MSIHDTVTVLDHAALQINDAADMDVQFKEIAGTTALVVDNVYRRPDYVRQLALDLSFGRAAGAYPGALAFISLSAQPVLDLINGLVRDAFGHELGFTDSYRDDMTFAVITKRGDELAANQCRPHTDGFCDYAALIYMNLPEQCSGGTSFWRHRRTGIEVEPGAPGCNPVLDKLASAGRIRLDADDGPWGYLLDSNSSWERTDVLEMRHNRLVLYSSYLYHSPLYDERDFGTTLDERRLTQNLYLARTRSS